MSETLIPITSMGFGRPHETCGYCDTKRHSNGPMVNAVMFPKRLSVRTYERLMFCCWRRSGTLLYAQKCPEDFCCPYYAIRLDAPAFRPSKSQRHVLAKWRRYLAREAAPTAQVSTSSASAESPETLEALNRALCGCARALLGSECPVETRVQANKECQWAARGKFATSAAVALFHKCAPLRERYSDVSALAAALRDRLEDTQAVKETGLRVVAMPSGHIGFFEACGSPKKKSKVEAAAVPPVSAPCAPRVLTVKAAPSAFDVEEFELYKKYQMAVHHDKEASISQEGFCDFLVDTPLVHEPFSGGTVLPGGVKGFGSYHVQYRVDGQLIAVGVVDVLPHSLSSVYCFYDPEFKETDLGTLVALKEIEWVRQASTVLPDMRYYVLGLYIHSCTKMKYKAQFHPSELYNRRTDTWVPLDDKCKARLDAGEAAGRPWVDLDVDSPSRPQMSRKRCAQLVDQCKYRLNADAPVTDSSILTERGHEITVNIAYPLFKDLGEWIFDGLCFDLNVK